MPATADATGLESLYDFAPAPTRRERAHATIAARAATLEQDGYTFEPITDAGPGAYWCQRPTPRIEKRTGELIEGYRLDLTDDGDGRCDCPAWQHYGQCKHLKALRTALERALRLLGHLGRPAR